MLNSTTLKKSSPDVVTEHAYPGSIRAKKPKLSIIINKTPQMTAKAPVAQQINVHVDLFLQVKHPKVPYNTLQIIGTFY